MTSPYYDASVQLPAGFNELPGFDPYWETYPLREDHLILGDGSENAIPGMAATVGPGETLLFEAMIVCGDGAGGTSTLKVKTPPNPNGGFQYMGAGFAEDWNAIAYGADSFNTYVGDLGTGISGTLNGYMPHYITGILANGDTPGLLQFALFGGAFVKPGSILRVHRIFDSRKNEVGA